MRPSKHTYLSRLSSQTYSIKAKEKKIYEWARSLSDSELEKSVRPAPSLDGPMLFVHNFFFALLLSRLAMYFEISICNILLASVVLVGDVGKNVRLFFPLFSHSLFFFGACVFFIEGFLHIK